MAMCGIFGWIKNDDDDLSGVVEGYLIKLSRRGKDASGFWVKGQESELLMKVPNRGDSDVVQKLVKDSSEIINSSKFLLGQTRLTTNGKENYDNNQPVVSDGLVLVHNGIVVNDRELADKYGINWCDGDSDSLTLVKVVRSLIEKRGFVVAVSKILREIVGSYSVAMYYQDQLILASNTGSLYLGEIDGRIQFASEARLFDQSEQCPKDKIICLKIDKGVVVRQDMELKVGRRVAPKSRLVLARKEIEKYKIDFKRIGKIKRCSKCILPETVPQISFDNKGVCNFCRNYKKMEIAGEGSLKQLVKAHRSKDGKPDCIIAFSGGRDSSYGLHYLVKKLGMHPVAVTFDWGMMSDLGRKNQAIMLGKLGVEQIVVAADIKKAREDVRKNLLAWLKKPDLGMVPLLMQGDKTTEYFVDKIRKELGVKLVFFCRGNSLEREEFKAGYCGVKNADPNGVIHDYSWVDKWRLLKYYLVQFLGNSGYWNRSLWSSFLGYLVTYIVPHNYVYLWHYIKWDEKEIIKTLTKEYGWMPDPESGMTWRIDDGSPAFYNYLYCQLQGFTENDSFRSNQIREGVMSRSEALKIVMRENQPRYAGIQWYLDTIGVKADKVLSAITDI
jgi:asparagine synthetase B (glutamine-hydrolysing)